MLYIFIFINCPKLSQIFLIVRIVHNFPGLKSFHETILLSACYQLFKSTLHTVEVKRSKVFKKY